MCDAGALYKIFANLDPPQQFKAMIINHKSLQTMVCLTLADDEHFCAQVICASSLVTTLSFGVGEENPIIEVTNYHLQKQDM